MLLIDGYVGINSFGFGGANCHVILKPNVFRQYREDLKTDPELFLLLCSGRTRESVEKIN